MDLMGLLKEMCDQDGSDLILTAGAPPLLRVDGELSPMGTDRMTSDSVRAMIAPLLTPEQLSAFAKDNELDCSFSMPGMGRFRLNVFVQRASMGAAIRRIQPVARTLEELGLPPVVAKLVEEPSGLVLVTGPTGSGKSTTLTAMVDRMNQHHHWHIVTVEDPIEFIHKNRLSVIEQREVGVDTASFSAALRRVFRQSPDVVMIGEARDLETVRAALSLSESGHLTLATLHTSGAVHAISRLIDIFPAAQQDQVRAQLAGSLVGVVAQQLLPRVNAKGRALAVEVLVATPAARAMIRDRNDHQLYSLMQTGADAGMTTLNQSLAMLIQRRTVPYSEAVRRSPSVAELDRILAREPAYGTV